MVTRAVLYLRQSKDQDRDELAVDRQREACEAIARARGWEVVAEFVDNDLSASDRRKTRPAYEAMVEAYKAGSFDAIICNDLDRLTRQPRQLEDWIDAAEERGLVLVTANGEADLSTDAGIMFAGIKAQVARAEVRRKSARQKAANRQRAQQGGVALVRRPFGYDLTIEHLPGSQHTRRTLTVRPDEADAIRWAYAHVLSGGSLREVAREWNRRGLVGPQKGRPWDGSTVGRTLRGARVAGLVTYKGEVVRDSDGQPVAAEWPAIVDLETWHAAQALFADPKRKFSPTFVSPFLLSGVAECGVCGAPIQSGGTRRTARGMVRRLRCSKKGGHVYREADLVEDYVEEQVLQYLAEADPARFAKVTDGPDVGALRAKVAELRSRGEGLAQLYADGTLTADELRAAKARLAERLAEVEAQFPTSVQAGAVLVGLVTAADLGRYWAGLTLDQQRAVVKATARVRLLPPGTKENARRWQEATWDDDGGQLTQAGWVCNPQHVLIDWLL